jgi:methyl-accepting chemotaxis protein
VYRTLAATFASAVLVFGMAACGSDSSDNEPANSPATTEAMTETTEAMTETSEAMTETTEAMTDNTDAMTETSEAMTESSGG